MMKLSKKSVNITNRSTNMSKSKKPILIAIFAVYCAALAYLTLLKGIGATFDMTYAEYIKANSNIIPFFSFYVFITTPYKSAVVVKYFIINLAGNLLLFLPWGLLLPSIAYKLRSFGRFFCFYLDRYSCHRAFAAVFDARKRGY